jgi:two-component system, cell cycle sensor histidine kinase and response regulator CckA
LATVYGIITQASGHVHLYSEPGIGTTFTALFPATTQPHTANETPPAVPRQRGGETVVVVEDEDAIREVTRRILTRNGYSVLTAATGPDAIGLIERHQGLIDLLITDVIMPQMLGKEVAEQAQVLRPGIRILFMSGYAQPVLAAQGTLDAGVMLVEKPFSEAALLARVRQVLDAEANP